MIFAASAGIPLEKSIQTSALNREEGAMSIFHLPCGWWDVRWPARFPVILFLFICLVAGCKTLLPTSCQEMMLCAFRRENSASLGIYDTVFQVMATKQLVFRVAA